MIWISEHARAARDTAGHLLYYEGTVEDITERRQYQVRIEHQANYDTLTGLANRSLLQDRLQQALLTAATRRWLASIPIAPTSPDDTVTELAHFLAQDSNGPANHEIPRAAVTTLMGDLDDAQRQADSRLGWPRHPDCKPRREADHRQ